MTSVDRDVRPLKLAIVGATGMVGEKIRQVLAERQPRIERVDLFASRSRGGVKEVTPQALHGYSAVFFAGPEDKSEQYASAILDRGGIVIDNSPAYRLHPGVPLIVPEVNAHAMRDEDRLFPVGNCTAIILCVALAPIARMAGLQAVRVATYQAVSGAGRAALEAFDRGDGNVVNNVIPAVGSFDANGNSSEESKVTSETRKVLELPELPLFVTAVRVPVRTAHCEVVFFETSQTTSAEELAAAFQRAPGVVYHSEGIVTPKEVEGTDDVHVARLRACGAKARAREFQMWIAGDQLRKGAATTAVQILELLLTRGSVR